MKLNTLNELLVFQLKDIYSAENQVADAWPRMIKTASDDQLRSALESHLKETKKQIQKLDQLFLDLHIGSKADKSVGMAGILEEINKPLKAAGDECCLDAPLIAAAQRAEHYEIAAYGCAQTYAKILGKSDTAEILHGILDEEIHADQKLAVIAGKVISP